MGKRRGLSYQKRVADINRIYDEYVKHGLPNREIWRRFIYPVYAISERQFYNILNASAESKNKIPADAQLYLDFWNDEQGQNYHKEDSERHPR